MGKSTFKVIIIVDLIFNELSFYPLADNDTEAEERCLNFLKCLKKAEKHLETKRVLFHTDCAKEMMTKDKMFIEVVSCMRNSTVKNLILSFIKKPFADDLEDNELEIFIESNYIIKNKPTHITSTSPAGLPIAHIKSTISISFNSDIFWENRKIQIISSSNTEDIEFTVYNICREDDPSEQEIQEWKMNIVSSTIRSEQELILYLSYSKYEVTFSPDFFPELINWKNNDIETFKRILRLMKDVEIHPFSGGIGKTESLTGREKEASKRITLADRLSYKIENNIIEFIACTGHYEHH